MPSELRLQLSEDGADAERLDALTRFLRQELLQLDVDAVTALPSGPAPAGSRGFDVVAVGGLMVSLGGSIDRLLPAVVATLRQWLRPAQGGGRMVRVEIDGDVLELSEATEVEQERLVGVFLARHTADGAT